MAFKIISWDFKREDGKVEMQFEFTDQQEESYSLVTPKIRVPKLQIQDLKKIVKQSQNVTNMRVFYSIYAKKIIEIEMGFVEMYNVKNENVYGAEMLGQIDKSTQFFRWGSVYNKESFDCQNVDQFAETFEFYQNLAKERILSIRTCLLFKDNDKRHAFPYNYVMLFDLQETIDFSLEYLTESTLKKEINDDYKQDLIAERAIWFQNKFNKLDWKKSKNIIIPFSYFSDLGFNLIIVELKQNENQKTQYHLNIHLSKSIPEEKSKLIKTQIQSYIQNLKLKISQDVFLSKEETNDLKSQLLNYVNLIEQKYFLIQNTAEQSNYIFHKLPEQLIVNPYNQALEGEFIIQNEEQMNKYRAIFI